MTQEDVIPDDVFNKEIYDLKNGNDLSGHISLNKLKFISAFYEDIHNSYLNIFLYFKDK